MARLIIGFDGGGLETAKQFARMYSKHVYKSPGQNFVVAVVGRIKNPNGIAADLLMQETAIDMKTYTSDTSKKRFCDSTCVADLTA